MFFLGGVYKVRVKEEMHAGTSEDSHLAQLWPTVYSSALGLQCSTWPLNKCKDNLLKKFSGSPKCLTSQPTAEAASFQ